MEFVKGKKYLIKSNDNTIGGEFLCFHVPIDGVVFEAVEKSLNYHTKNHWLILSQLEISDYSFVELTGLNQ
jgi:hypothetical protein